MFFLKAGFLLVIAIFLAGTVSGQQTFYDERFNSDVDYIPVEKLRRLLADATLDTNRINYHIDIAQHFIFHEPIVKSDIDSATVHLNRAFKLATHIQSKQFSYQVLLIFAKLYDKSGRRDDALKSYERAIAIARQMNNKILEADCLYYSVRRIHSNEDSLDVNKFQQRALSAYRLYATYGKTAQDRYKQTWLLKEQADDHLNANELDLAVKELLQVIEIHKKYHIRDVEYAYDLLSAVYERRGELSKALYYALESVKIVQLNNQQIPDTFLNRVAAAYESIGKTEESIVWYTKSYNSTPKNSPFLFVPTYALASQLIKLGQADKALALTKKTWNEFPNRAHAMDTFIYLAFEECYTAKKQYSAAYPYIKKLLTFADGGTLYPSWNASIYFSVSNFYLAQKMYVKALEYASKAIANQKSMPLPRQIQLNETLYKVDLALNKPVDAFSHFKEYHRLRDSIFSQQNLNAIERLQIEFKTSQKENENEILIKKAQLQDQEVTRLQVVKNFSIGLLICLSIVLLLLYGRFRLKKKHHAEAARQKSELDIAYAKLETTVQQKNQLLEDKETLIKEVHHRVKNNLQLTMSLLNSQSYYLEDASAIAAIRDSQHRLKSIALIHQKLYQSDIVSLINIRPYIVELINYLRDSISDGKDIQFNLDIMDLNMDIATAVPMGLFINEVVTNSFKYAFAEAKTGLIDISLKPFENERYLLCIKDNGVGFPKDFDYKNGNTLGMTLMRGLSGQIGGELTIESRNGLSICLAFDNNEQFQIHP